LHGQPSFQIVEDGGGVLLSQFGTAIWRGAAGLFLDGIKLCNPTDGFFGDGGAALGARSKTCSQRPGNAQL
jgi:hypothetical protein